MREMGDRPTIQLHSPKANRPFIDHNRNLLLHKIAIDSPNPFDASIALLAAVRKTTNTHKPIE